MDKNQVFTIYFTFEDEHGNSSAVPVEVEYTGIARTIGSVTFYTLRNTRTGTNYSKTAEFINSAQPEPVPVDHATDVIIR